MNPTCTHSEGKAFVLFSLISNRESKGHISYRIVVWAKAHTYPYKEFFRSLLGKVRMYIARNLWVPHISPVFGEMWEMQPLPETSGAFPTSLAGNPGIGGTHSVAPPKIPHLAHRALQQHEFRRRIREVNQPRYFGNPVRAESLTQSYCDCISYLVLSTDKRVTRRLSALSTHHIPSPTTAGKISAALLRHLALVTHPDSRMRFAYGTVSPVRISPIACGTRFLKITCGS
jgi:hypothetical protein